MSTLSYHPDVHEDIVGAEFPLIVERITSASREELCVLLDALVDIRDAMMRRELPGTVALLEALQTLINVLASHLGIPQAWTP